MTKSPKEIIDLYRKGIISKQQAQKSLFEIKPLQSASEEKVDFPVVLEYVTDRIANHLHFEKEQLDIDTEFSDFGVESVESVNIISYFEKDLGPLSKTLLLEHNTIRLLSEYLYENYRSNLKEHLFSIFKSKTFIQSTAKAKIIPKKKILTENTTESPSRIKRIPEIKPHPPSEPISKTVVQVLSIFSTILYLHPNLLRASYFLADLGLDQFDEERIIERLNEEFNATITIDDFKGFSCISDVANFLDQESFQSEPISENSLSAHDYFVAKGQWRAIQHEKERKQQEVLRKIVFFTSKTRYLSRELEDAFDESFHLSVSDDFSSINSVMRIFLEQVQNDMQGSHSCSYVVLADESEFLSLSFLWGFFKTLQIENPGSNGLLFILEEFQDEFKQNLKEIILKHISSNNTCVKWNAKQNVLSNYGLYRFDPQVSSTPLFKNQSTYLITGGMGGIGKNILRNISKNSSKTQIIITGRSSLNPEKWKELINTVPKNIRLEYHQCDVSNFDQVCSLIQKIHTTQFPLKGIIHSAGVLRDRLIIQKQIQEVKEVLAPKILGAQNLDRATQYISLDYFLLFSSEAGFFGNIGQVDYSSANSYLDFFAQNRNELCQKNRRRGVTISVSWPYWKNGGMQMPEKRIRQMYEDYGVQPLETSIALNFLQELIHYNCSQVFIVQGDIEKVQKVLQIPNSPDLDIEQKEIVEEDISEEKILLELSRLLE